MDAKHFDTVALALSVTDTRRGLLGTLAGLGAALGLSALDAPEGAAKRKRHGRRRSHRPGNGKANRKGKRKGKPKSKAVACSSHSDCGANALCLSDGACQPCSVTCSGGPEACGTALQTALNTGGTIFVCPGTYQGGFTIKTAVTVVGAGQGDLSASNTILDGNDAARVVQIEPGTGTVDLTQLRITGGASATGHGGISHEGTMLRMTDCTVSDNDTGGISTETDTTLELAGCTFSGNQSGGGGGAISSSGTLALTDCIIERNSAPFGGGLATGGPTTLSGTTALRRNTARIAGGGIIVFGGSLTIADTCRVTENSPGGIYVQDLTATVTLQGADPSPIVVDNCPENCTGNPVPKCAPGGTCPV